MQTLGRHLADDLVWETPALQPLRYQRVSSPVLVGGGWWCSAQGSRLNTDTSLQVWEALRTPVPPEPVRDQRDAGRPGWELGRQVGVLPSATTPSCCVLLARHWGFLGLWGVVAGLGELSGEEAGVFFASQPGGPGSFGVEPSLCGSPK